MVEVLYPEELILQVDFESYSCPCLFLATVAELLADILEMAAYHRNFVHVEVEVLDSKPHHTYLGAFDAVEHHTLVAETDFAFHHT